MGMEMETSPSPDDAKACADCHTTKTPLWRGGPQGPKSLCNACGIRYRKRRRHALGLAAADPQQDEQKTADPQQDQPQHQNKTADPQQEQQPKKRAASSSTSKKDKEIKKDKETKKKERQVTVELRVVGFGKEAVMLKQRRQMRRNKCLSEEERAAVLLMALSSGVIYAS